MIQSIAIKGEDKQTMGREKEKQNKTLDATGHYRCIKDVIKRGKKIKNGDEAKVCSSVLLGS